MIHKCGSDFIRDSDSSISTSSSIMSSSYTTLNCSNMLMEEQLEDV